MARLTALFRTYGKYAFLLAIAFGVAGAIALGVTGVMSKLYLSLLGLAVIFLLLWGGWLWQRSPGFFGRRSTQSGANVIASTLAVLVILTLINYIAFRYPVSWDLTENQRFTLAPQSQSLVSALEEPLKVWIFDDAPSDQDRKLLQNYQRFSDQFSFEFVHPDRRPQLVQKFNVQNKGDVFIEYGDKNQLVQNLLSFQQRQALSEIQLTNAIANVQRQETPHIYLVQGHGELSLNNEPGGISEGAAALENLGFVVQPLNLVTDGGIPTDADAVIIAGPTRKFLPPEVETLQQYTDQGGNLLVMMAPDADAGLEDVLEPWGVSFDPRLVIDLSGAGSVFGLDPTVPIFNRYGNHPITEKLQGAIAIFPLVQPVATTEKPQIEATTLVEASDLMYATQLISEDLQPNPETDLLGPFDVAVALTRQGKEADSVNGTETQNESDSSSDNPSEEIIPSPSPAISPTLSPSHSTNQPKITDQEGANPNEGKEESPTDDAAENGNNENDQAKTESKSYTPELPPAKMVVVGTTAFATNAWFNEAVNGDIFLNSVQWLAENVDQPLSLRAKDPTDRRINLGVRRAMVLGWLTWVIVPLIGIGLAVFTWWRQR
ncbi:MULTISPECIES: Gldg family protein [unclassified Synechocystis]|uniref:GldG family protein n=1 Tax=unclassified Synechocystis TaxID=2640012 RepID=UPI0004075939|nr:MULTISPECIES: Gldg family protein [unclassified Synechocystis]AIE72711.1 Mucin 2 precursor [Synechocystis sp. PCC 6714]MCT0254636.1 Gldg family protein [Synechocystis sp. CS-94]